MTYSDNEAYAEELNGKRGDELDGGYLDLRSDAIDSLGTAHLVAVLPACASFWRAGRSRRYPTC